MAKNASTNLKITHAGPVFSPPFQVFISSPQSQTTDGVATIVVTVSASTPCLALKYKVAAQTPNIHPCNIRLFTQLGYQPLPDDSTLGELKLGPLSNLRAKFLHCYSKAHHACCSTSWYLIPLPQQYLWIPKTAFCSSWTKNGPFTKANYNFEAQWLPTFCNSKTTFKLTQKPLLFSAQHNFFMSDKYSDFSFAHKDGLLPAHSFIILQHSQLLYELSSRLSFDLKNLKTLLHFVYFKDLPSSLTLSEHITLRQAGLTFKIPRLVVLCNTEIQKEIDALTLAKITSLLDSFLPQDIRKKLITRLLGDVKHSKQSEDPLKDVPQHLLKELLYHSCRGLSDNLKLETLERLPATAFLTPFELFETGQGSDLTIQTGPFSFNVHKIVLCVNCTFFRSMFDGNFAESKERHLIFPIEDYPIPAFGEFLRLLYTGSIFFSSPSMAMDTAALGHLLLGNAEEDMLKELYTSCSNYLVKSITTVDCVVEFLSRDMTMLPTVTAACLKLLKGFYDTKQLTRTALESLPKRFAYDLLFPE